VRLWCKNNSKCTKCIVHNGTGLLCLGHNAGTLSEIHNKKWPTLPRWRLLHWQYGMIFHKSSLTKQSYHFATNVDCWQKAMRRFICYSWVYSVYICFNKICRICCINTYKIWKFDSNACYHCWNTIFYRELFCIIVPIDTN